MPISTIREARGLTAQTLADMALQAHQAARRSLDLLDRAEHMREAMRLADLSKEVAK
jgi:hypothetical protein